MQTIYRSANPVTQMGDVLAGRVDPEEKTSRPCHLKIEVVHSRAIVQGIGIALPSCMTNAQRIISWFDAYGPDGSIELDIDELDKLNTYAEKSGYWNHRDIRKMVETLKHLRGWNPRHKN
jgi:hypothetical protein